MASARPEPDDALARADAAYQEGALDEARALCLDALRGAPEELRALCLMAAVMTDAKRIDEGAQWARRAIAAWPQAGAAHYSLGRVFESAGRYADAEANYRNAVRLDPRHAKAHNNLGACLHMQGRLDEAIACYRRALEIDPAQPQANQNYAAFVRDPRAQQAAIAGYRRRIQQNPRDAAALASLGNLLIELGRGDEALACLERATQLEPDYAQAHFSKAFLLLLRGDYARGWREYAWRWRIEAFNSSVRRFPQPVWDGRPLARGSVLIHGETGLGDMLQFVRYAPLVAERVGTVLLECPPTLQPLLAGFAGVSRVLPKGEALPEFSAHVPLAMLPGMFGATLDELAWRGPYIHADAARVAAWGALVSADAGLKVGLVWAGNPAHWADRKRSLPLSALAPLARVPRATFYSLQVGPAAAEAASPPAGLRLVDDTARIRDFSDTAALASLLDVVVSVDTSVCHLGGAMGVPTWVLLSFAPDWRFHLERRDNPWYPGMRLFRQPSDGDWAAPVEMLAGELTRLAQGR